MVHGLQFERRQCLLAPVISLAAFGALQHPAYAALIDDDRAAAVFEATSANSSSPDPFLDTLGVRPGTF